MSRIRFSTLDVPPARALEHWERSIERELFDANIRPFRRDAFVATCTLQRAGDVGTMFFDTSAVLLERSDDLVRRSPKPSVFVSAVLAGEAAYFDGNGTYLVPAGSVLVYSPQRPYHLSFSHGFRQLFLDVPTDQLTLPDQRAAVVRADALHGVAGAPSVAQLTAAVEAGDAEHETAVHAEALVAALARTLAEGAPSRFADAARLAVQRLHADPDVGVEDIAATVAVSSRHLNRALAAEGTSLGKLLAAQRLETGLRLLDSTAFTVNDVATRSGFQGATQLGRAVRAARGLSPTDYRRRPRGTTAS